MYVRTTPKPQPSTSTIAFSNQFPPQTTRESIDSRRSPPPDELLSPLATLYPHVTALQPQYNPDSCTFTGYRHTGYWASAYTTQPLEEPPFTPRRGSGTFHSFCIIICSSFCCLSLTASQKSPVASSPNSQNCVAFLVVKI